MRRISLFALLLAACADDKPIVLPSELESATHHLAVSADGLTLFEGTTSKLNIPRAAFVLGTLRQLDSTASYDPYWLEHMDAVFTPDPPADLVWRPATTITVGDTTRTTAALSMEFGGGFTATMTIEATADDRFRLRWKPADNANGVVAWMRVVPVVGADEGFYGLGEWPDHVNHRGQLRPMQMEADLMVESANDENHVPVPLLIGTRAWGLFVKSRRAGTFDVARETATEVVVTYGTAESSTTDGLEMVLIGAPTALDVTHAYYVETSAPNLPAPWALGPWIWRDESRDQAEVESDVETIRRLDLATTAIWIDRPYATKVNTFDFDPAKFADPVGMIAKIHGAGLRLGLWSTPYLEPGAEPQLGEATSRGYFPPVVGTLLNRWGQPIDLTKPEAFDFWQAQVQKYRDLGVEGFKLDYAEDVIVGLSGSRNVWEFADGSDDRTMHYGYTRLYHQVYGETLPSETGFLLCRAGRWGDQEHVSVIWPGDMDATFTRHREVFTPRGDTDSVIGTGGLPATVVQGMGLGPSGFPFFGADTGGYRHSPPDRELYIRWFQQTALSTVMQVGDSSSQPPWEFNGENGRDQASLDLYRSFARLHLRLFPYLWTHAKLLASTGRAIQRPIGLMYPELALHPDDQYLLGDDLLVAPVLDRGAVEKSVVFPPGEWVDWFSGARHTGPRTETVAAPLDTLPLFVRAGAPVPLLRPSIDTLSAVTDPVAIDSFATTAGVLHVRIAPGAEAVTRILYDGTKLEAAPASLNVTPGSVFVAGMWIEQMTSDVTPVLLDGTALATVSSTTALEAADRGVAVTSGRRHVKIPAGSHRLTF